ncbi:hypothetical protein K402DRAFT_408778 [Aulographum hederae CBS 113979]|uniref:H-type lectin domain-containing protein n=1 Tax=Aulographum hederae CBS 113979 TaxID=1176131 RepID=A0A6G1GJC8_9PEZI|nr:hypothetical protein K402DRAFT_408778 [Aulographum hederae CBS 113979]
MPHRPTTSVASGATTIHHPQPFADTGHFSTLDVRERTFPTTRTCGTIRFPQDNYHEPPNLAAGFSALDLSNEGPLRANLVGTSITPESFKITVETWKDKHGEGTLYAADAVWIERKRGAHECVFGQFDTRDARLKLAQLPENEKLQGRGKVRTAHARSHEKQADLVAPPSENSKTIAFPKVQFEDPPAVICWLNRLDLASGGERNYRIRASASNITATTFEAHLDTWGDSVLYGGAMSYIAFPTSKKYVDSGMFSTSDVRPWHDPRPVTRGRVKFRQEMVERLSRRRQRGRWRPPTVLAGLNMLDCAGNAGLSVRVEIKEDEIDEEGFWWEVRAGGECTCYAAGVGWIALGF